ncbi:phage baseplate protein [Erwiniaceae bacterium BAC15a-03b]|uniref:Phage baseplate protein n=1 Tax=Winslowiella arboricola TaxID=2978220 RepID=A0A9J6PTV8_9GAMM|nr:phage baseplate protein [Winslowiella arboricola]MCU5780118.1 phage baseplate protein [Winslowiella arboricola]
MSDAQKFPFAKALTNVITTAWRDNDALRGRALPCHVVAVKGQIVTVQFDLLPGGVQYPQITIPIATFAYIRYPVQPGDKGVTVPADVSLRGISGLGTDIASLSLSPSLTPLFFVPLANVTWSDEDPRKVTVYGPEGVICKTVAGDATVTIEPGKVTLKAAHIYLEGTIHLNGKIVQDAGQIPGDATASLIGPLSVQNDATINGVSVSQHGHDIKNVQGGNSTVTSEKPNPGGTQ